MHNLLNFQAQVSSALLLMFSPLLHILVQIQAQAGPKFIFDLIFVSQTSQNLTWEVALKTELEKLPVNEGPAHGDWLHMLTWC